jgi:hypothetical protein
METGKRRQKKKYEWLVFFALINWLAIGLVIWKVDPDTIKDFILPGSYLPMTLLVMGGIFWLFSILFMSAVTALRWTVGITAFLELRLLGLGSVFNGILILGLLISWEVYSFKTKHETKNPAI